MVRTQRPSWPAIAACVGSQERRNRCARDRSASAPGTYTPHPYEKLGRRGWWATVIQTRIFLHGAKRLGFTPVDSTKTAGQRLVDDLTGNA
jgi:hypothetical protein